MQWLGWTDGWTVVLTWRSGPWALTPSRSEPAGWTDGWTVQLGDVALWPLGSHALSERAGRGGRLL